uniref:Uncharacterized protein n=1 Tax=Solanum tuberosum TaxID=4113 RepID=M1DPH2_SOLTU
MAGQNEENLPFIWFPDATSRERHHDNRNMGFCCESGFVLHKLEEKAPTFHARLMEFGWAPLTEDPPDGRSTYRLSFTSRGKKRRTGRASSSKVAAGSDDEVPLSGALVEEDLVAVRKRLGSAYTDFTPVSPSTTLEVEMLRRELRQERTKGLARDHLMVRIWKTMRTIFTCVAPGQELPWVEKGNFKNFTFLDEAVTGLVPPKDLCSDVDTSQSQSP